MSTDPVEVSHLPSSDSFATLRAADTCSPLPSRDPALDSSPSITICTASSISRVCLQYERARPLPSGLPEMPLSAYLPACSLKVHADDHGGALPGSEGRYGADMGTLSVELSLNGSQSWSTVWSISGQQQPQRQDDWHYAQTELLQPDVECDTLQLRWKGNWNNGTGTPGPELALRNGTGSAMAIDTIVFSDNPTRHCSCVNGFPEIGDNCPYDGAPHCSSCLDTFELNTLNATDIKCVRCSCPYGTAARGNNCPYTGKSSRCSCQRPRCA